MVATVAFETVALARSHGPDSTLELIQHRCRDPAHELALLVQLQRVVLKPEVRGRTEHDHGELIRVALILFRRMLRDADPLAQRKAVASDLLGKLKPNTAVIEHHDYLLAPADSQK
jgi:hypothetical protein